VVVVSYDGVMPVVSFDGVVGAPMVVSADGVVVVS
jgi:hypothetical protein